ncbi:MAG TPA: hypothetical protein VGG39_17840 [Polyangiaceae bacterium]|jgi:hypothetical protein
MRLLPWVVLAAALGAVACEDTKPPSDSAKSDGGKVDKYASADPKLEQAIQAAASASAAANAGPPPTGIFDVTTADQKHPKGAPTKVDMVSDGSDPKVSLAASADASPDAARATSYGPAVMQLAIEQGRGMGIAMDLGMVITPPKKDESPDWLVANVVRASPSKQMGQIPPGLDKDLAGLQSSELRLKVTADGRESDILVQLGKTAKPELERLAQTAAEALVFATIPAPPKPVGVGAQWIAETRMPLSQVDAIAYRAYRVKSIDGNRIHLTLEVKAYAAGKELNIAGIPKGATFEQFEAAAEGDLELVRGETLARKSDVQQRIVMVFAGPGGIQPPQQPGGQPGNMMSAQIGSQATFVRGDDLKAAMKQP